VPLMVITVRRGLDFVVCVANFFSKMLYFLLVGLPAQI
jgi:hypothetical protein